LAWLNINCIFDYILKKKPLKLLAQKTAIVTGATRGIGKAIAIEFAKQGANVAFTYNSSASAVEDLEKTLTSMGVKAKGYQSNAAEFTAAESLIKEVLEEFGEISILVNNAGITKDNLLMRMSEDDFDKVIQINLKSVFNLTKAVIKPMMKQKKGSIINMSSIVGLKGNAGQANYAASKAGILGFTKSIALELGSRNIRCNAIAPGFIETEMTENLSEESLAKWRANIPLKRGGTPQDVASACTFLASDMSAYITGQTLSVDGGL
jgi:3-oxoacyl-[acyl-carrier protein] reductase